MTDHPVKRKLFIEKISKVMKDLGAVDKDGKNTSQSYSYMSHANLMKHLHPLLTKEKLLIYMADVEVLPQGAGHVITKQRYIITDGDCEIAFYGVGEGVDTYKSGTHGDKATYKALTGAHKYALKQLFTIPDEMDAEDSSKEDKVRADGEKVKPPKELPKPNDLPEWGKELNNTEVLSGVKWRKGNSDLVPRVENDKIICPVCDLEVSAHFWSTKKGEWVTVCRNEDCDYGSRHVADCRTEVA